VLGFKINLYRGFLGALSFAERFLAAMGLVGTPSLLGLSLGMIGCQSMTAGLLWNSTNTGISSAAQFDRPDQGVKGVRAISFFGRFFPVDRNSYASIRWPSTNECSVYPLMPSQ
jgi:hypothetical protein